MLASCRARSASLPVNFPSTRARSANAIQRSLPVAHCAVRSARPSQRSTAAASSHSNHASVSPLSPRTRGKASRVATQLCASVCSGRAAPVSCIAGSAVRGARRRAHCAFGSPSRSALQALPQRRGASRARRAIKRTHSFQSTFALEGPSARLRTRAGVAWALTVERSSAVGLHGTVLSHRAVASWRSRDGCPRPAIASAASVGDG